MTITQAELDAIRARARAAAELPFYSATATDVIEEDVPKLLAEVERKAELIAQIWNVLNRSNDLLDDAYELLEDSVYYNHPTTDAIAEYLNVKGSGAND